MKKKNKELKTLANVDLNAFNIEHNDVMIDNKLQIEKIGMLKLAKRSFSILWKYSIRNKYLLIFILIMTLISAGCQVFGIFVMGQGLSDIFKNFLIVNVPPGLIPGIVPVSASYAFNVFIITISLMGGLYLIQFTTTYLQTLALVKVSQNIGFYLRSDLMQKIQKLPFKYLDTRNTGDLMSSFTNDVDAVVTTFSQGVNQILTTFAMVIGVLLSMFLINPILAAVSVGLLLTLFSFIAIFIKKAQPYFAKQQKVIGQINGDTEEFIAAHKMTTLYKYQKPIIEIFKKKNDDLKGISSMANMISGMIYPYNNFINNLLITVISCVLIVLQIFAPNLLLITVMNNLIPAAVAILFITFLRQMTSQVATVFTLINQFQLAFAALDRIKVIIDEQNEPNLYNEKLNVINADVEFKNVSFGYNEDKLVLKNISFKAKKDTMNAIVGPTGSGKTTIISLLTRFYDINQGQILIDNKDILKHSRNSLRSEISIVLQDSFLFDNTIMENIRVGRLDATDVEVIRAAKFANADKFIKKLPKGYKTCVSNNTESLSEGEKQLISIARAFLSRAKILILDEATSYVDTKTEKDIQMAMKKLMKSRTSFVIAHRLSTIKDADNIVVIKDGEMIESGNHKALMIKNGFYAKLNNALDSDIDKIVAQGNI